MHVLPKLLPEELLEGYRGRLSFLNGSCRSTLVSQRLGQRLGQPQGVSWVELTARYNNMRVNDVVMLHTMWPFISAIDRPAGNEAVERLACTRAGRTAMGRVIRQPAMHCARCVEEDLDFWGFSFWRRDHQLPGALRCNKHEQTLSDSGPGLDGLPHHRPNPEASLSTAWVEELRAKPPIMRFERLCATVLESAPVISLKSAQREICSRVLRRGLCASVSRAGAALTRFAVQEIPMAWLQRALPKIQWGHPERITVFDAACGLSAAPISTTALLLAAAMVFDSADEALPFMTGDPVTAKGVGIEAEPAAAGRYGNL